ATPLRPPLFPLLLAVTSYPSGIDSDTSLIVAHIGIGALVIAATFLLMAGSTPPLLCVFAAGFSLYSAKQVGWGIMSEWLGMSLLFLAVTLYLGWTSRPSSRRALAVSICLSLAMFTRVAFLPWLALPFFIILQAPRGGRRVTATAVTAGLVPLLMWSAINLHRVGTFSILPHERLNLLATARSLGPIPCASSDTEEQRYLITLMNERGTTVSDAGLEPDKVHTWDGEFYGAFHANFNLATDALYGRENPASVRSTALAARALSAYTDRYRRFLRGGIHTLLIECMPLVLSCMVVAGWIMRRDPIQARRALGVITVCVVSLGYLAAIFGTMLWLRRYFVPIQPILLFCLTISVATLLKTFLGPIKN
ncbi:MAG: hypothetical protein RIS36_169, partial [Pseudomonadota bacterium]